MNSDTNYWLRGRRLSRRRVVAGAGVAIAGTSVVLAGCGGDSSPETTPASGSPGTTQSPAAGSSPTSPPTPKTGGTLRLSYSGSDAHLSPVHTGGFDFSFVDSTMYEYMWGTSTEGTKLTVNFRQAASVEQPTDDTYLIHLSPDAFFQDIAPVSGRPTSAEDVKMLCDYIAADKTVFARQFLATAVDSVSAVDEKTVQVKTKGVQADFYDGGVGFNRPLVPKELTAQGDMTKVEPIGSGPWQFDSQTHGSFLEVVRFPKWRVSGQPYIDKVRRTLISDEAARETAFRGGQLDVIEPSNYQMYTSLTKDMGNQVSGFARPSVPIGFSMNGQRATFDDPRVREAIHRAIDFKKLLEVVAFGQGKLCGVVGPDLAAFALPESELGDYLKFDPAAAKQLLQQSGFDLGKSYDFVTRPDVAVYQALTPLIQQMLQDVGLKINVVAVPQAQFQQRTFPKPGDFDFTFAFMGANIGRVLLDHATESGGAKQCFGNKDPEYDQLLAKASATLDADARTQIYLQAQKRLLEIWPISFPLYSPDRFFISRKELMGIDQSLAITYSQQPQEWFDK